jgi:hypothetical protein
MYILCKYRVSFPFQLGKPLAGCSTERAAVYQTIVGCVYFLGGRPPTTARDSSQQGAGRRLLLEKLLTFCTVSQSVPEGNSNAGARPTIVETPCVDSRDGWPPPFGNCYLQKKA